MIIYDNILNIFYEPEYNMNNEARRCMVLPEEAKG